MRFHLFIVPILLSTLQTAGVAAEDWPMLGHDAARSGTTATELQPPFQRKWYRLFGEEGLMSGIQPIVAGGKLFVGTLHGVLHAMNLADGRDVWTFKTERASAILHSCAAADGKVFFGAADGAVYALDGQTGTLSWKVQTGAAVWNAPVWKEGVLWIGSRDGRLYAIDATAGRVLWTAPTDGPILNSPAVGRTRDGHASVYVASEDMHLYAFDARDGRRLWRSEKLPGISLRGYHPVIAPDGSVLVTTAPGISVDTFQALLLEMVKALFGDFASWRHKKEENTRLREENFRLLQKPEIYQAQLDYLRKRCADEPTYQTFFVLDPVTGRQKFVTPIIYSESMNGPGAPPLVSAEGKVIVKYQALLRSRYEHYSPFLNVGYLDTASGIIAPLLDESRTYGWYDSLLLVHDEQCQLSLSGHILLNTHQDNVNGLNLQTRQGFAQPFCLNVHEPAKGEAVGIWARLLRDQPLPVGKEWLARGTAIYGGGSVLDVPVTIAGRGFYYLPTHELNAGAAIIAYEMNPQGTAGQKIPAPIETLTDKEWKQIQQSTWDWDTLEMPRLTHVLEALPGPMPGTRRAPLTNEAAKAVAAITDGDLDRVIWEGRRLQPGPLPSNRVQSLKRKLAAAVLELIRTEWRPLLFPSGKFPEEAYRFFDEPTETLYTLALAYPHLEAELQQSVRTRIARLSEPGGPLAEGIGRRVYEPVAGTVRSAYDPPPERLLHMGNGIVRTGIARLYPIWFWAWTSGDWTLVEKNWPVLKRQLEQPRNKMEEDCRNGEVAGLIAYCRMARRLQDAPAEIAGVERARAALRERLKFEFAHTRGGLIWQLPKLRSTFARWHFLTPELGRCLAQHVGDIHRQLMDIYVDHHRPTWWLAWNVETMMRNECPYEFPTASAEIFAARRLILNEGGEQLESFVDLPWCRGDEYYIQKLALTLEASQRIEWISTK